MLQPTISRICLSCLHCYVIIDDWDTHDLFVHCWVKLNSPLVHPVPSPAITPKRVHVRVAARVGGSIWPVTDANTGFWCCAEDCSDEGTLLVLYVIVPLLYCQVDKLRKWKQDHVEQMASDLEDDAVSGNDVDQRLSDLRKEVLTSSYLLTFMHV